MEGIEFFGQLHIPTYGTVVRPNKKICVFRVTGLKKLGREGTHIFSGKNIVLCILKGILPYNFMHFERRFAFQNA